MIARSRRLMWAASLRIICISASEAIPKKPCQPRTHALTWAMQRSRLPPQLRGVSCRTLSIALRLVRSDRSTSTTPDCGSRRNRNPREVAILGPGDRRLGLVHLQAQAPFDEAGQAGHHPLPRPLACHIHLGVVGIASEPVTTPGRVPDRTRPTRCWRATATAANPGARLGRCRSPHRLARPP